MMSDSHGEPRFFPVELDLHNRRCLVVGGGRIGTRKAVTLAHAGARVTVVSPVITKSLSESAANGLVHWIDEPFRSEHVEGMFMVVAATDADAVNADVVEAAARAGALACDASSADRSQLIFGATLRRDDTTVAVFTDGRDPTHARQTRDRIAMLLEAERAERNDGGRSTVEPDREPSSRPGAGVRQAEPGVPATLVMIGASLPGGLPAGRGPRLRHSEPRAFARAKKSHKALRAFLDWVRENTPVCEAFVWNTCQRIEFYGWLPAGMDAEARERLAVRIRHGLYGDGPGRLEVNVLIEEEARHHLFRTACGLNSDLPGDRDVAAQLQTACRLAACAGVAGVRATRLVEEALDLADTVTKQTAWSRYCAGYCEAALARVFEEDGVRVDELRFVVIGGSTTSRSVLSALTRKHGVPERQLTAVYRDHHGQMKQMRAALGNGRRIRVHAYSDERVLRAINGADYVVFGIDQEEPVIDAAAFVRGRDEAAGPLTIVDFNTFGSVDGLDGLPSARVWTAAELDHAVAAHVAITTTRSGFSCGVNEAETAIEMHLAKCAARGDSTETTRNRAAGV